MAKKSKGKRKLKCVTRRGVKKGWKVRKGRCVRAKKSKR